MPPLLDHLAVAAIIAGALCFFLLRFLRKRAGKGCASDCGCSAAKAGKLPR